MSRVVIAVLAGLLLAAGCGNADEPSGASTASTTPPVSTTTTSAPAPTSTTPPPATTSTTVVATGEPPVIHLAGSTTVYSQDGSVRVSGWLDGPGDVMVGDTPADMLDDQYHGISTFEIVLDLEPGSHTIAVAATDERGLESEIVLGVLVDPAIEMQLAMIDDVSPVERTVMVDAIEFLVGDEATRAAREDGVIGQSEETPGGFYVRNLDPELLTFTLGDSANVTLQACFVESGPCVVEQAVDLETWIEMRSNPELAEARVGWAWYGAAVSPYWLTLQDGVVVQITEQYLP